MTKLLEYLITILGAWLAVSTLILGTQMPGLVVSASAGIAIAALALVGTRSKTVQWNFMAIAAIGACLFVWGIVAGIALPGCGGVNESIVGALAAVLALFVLPFQVDVTKATFYNRGGGELARVEKISEKKGNLLAKAVLLNSMPETIFIKPEELCYMLSLIDFEVISALPGILYQGWKVNREAEKAAKQKQ